MRMFWKEYTGLADKEFLYCENQAVTENFFSERTLSIDTNV